MKKPQRTLEEKKELVMEALPGTYQTLAEKTGMSYSTVREVIHHLVADGQIHEKPHQARFGVVKEFSQA